MQPSEYIKLFEEVKGRAPTDAEVDAYYQARDRSDLVLDLRLEQAAAVEVEPGEGLTLT